MLINALNHDMKILINYKVNGFSIVELIIAGAISITTIGIGFSLLQIALKGNKIDETQMGLNGRINDTLDFILDEVKASKRIINDESKITELNENCTFSDSDEFLFGIRLPDQALTKSEYLPEGDQFNLNQVECPIIYSLRPSENQEFKQYSLVRFGPQYNEIGYYVSPSYLQFQETILLDGITSDSTYKKITCPNGWNDIQTIRGISFCIDKFKKAIEIQIESSDPSKGINNEIRSIASVGGFSSIQDESQINIFSSPFISSNSLPVCMGGQCCLIGICLKSNKVTYLIDSSFVMNANYLHYNGLKENGNWQSLEEADLIEPKINGKSLFEYVIGSLRYHITNLPLSKDSSEENTIYIQIISNNGVSNYLFEEGPQKLTAENKILALNFLDDLQAETLSQLAINPWDDICNSIESEYIGQLVILSASNPSTTLASSNQPCVGIESGEFSEIINDYNQLKRSESATGSLIIDSMSLFHNFCESSKNYLGSEWLGLISRSPESSCIHIK